MQILLTALRKRFQNTPHPWYHEIYETFERVESFDKLQGCPGQVT